MNKFIIPLIFTLFVASKTKYKTWSLERDENFSPNVINLWQIKPLETFLVEPGKGDFKIYFKNEKSKNDLFYIPNNAFFLPNNKIEYNSCHFDTVTLLNGYSYFIFTMHKYKRLDSLNVIENGIVQHPFITIVDAMYRSSDRGNYIIISNKEYFELDSSFKFVKQGLLESLFPYVTFVDAAVQLRNGSIFIFSDKEVYRDKQNTTVLKNDTFNGTVRGVFQMKDDSIRVVDEQYLWYFDKNFNFINKTLLCESDYFSNFYCCE